MNYLAVLPSNQTHNAYSEGNTNELAQMGKLAGWLAACSPVETKVIVPQPDRPGTLAELYNQIAAGVAWLRSKGATAQTGAMLSLHSDSSGSIGSHILGCYGGMVNSASYNLASHTGESLQDLMRTGFYQCRDYSAYAFYTLSQGYPAALLECGSHQDPHDLDFLLNRRDEMARAIARGVGGYFQVAPVEVVMADGQQVFSSRGVACNPDSAIFKHWQACFNIGDFANLGSALTPELPGAQYGENGNLVQFFESGVVVCKPGENWRCYHAQVCLDPARWGLSK